MRFKHPEIFFDDATPAHGGEKTRVPSGSEDDIAALPPPPSVPDPLLAETAPALLPLPAEDDLLPQGDASDDFVFALGPQSVDEQLPPSLRAPATRRAAPPRAKPQAPLPPPAASSPRGRVYLGAFTVVLAIAGAGIYHCVTTPAPAPVPPPFEDAVASGKARVECPGGEAPTAATRKTTSYSCPTPGRVVCENPGGCMVRPWGWDWVWVGYRRAFKMESTVYHHVAPAVRAVATVEPRL